MATLRICTWNTWHGLNPFQRPLMLPLENPLARYLRWARQVEAIRELRQSKFDVFCFQEVNPLHSRLKKLERKLDLRGYGCLVNAGLRIGPVGFPPFLSEGLAILVDRGFKKRRTRELALSGTAREIHAPLGLDLIIQLEERRKALYFEANAGNVRVAIVNLHLHNGPSFLPDVKMRRKSEMSRLARFLRTRLPGVDLAVVCGDFNCDPDSRAMSPLLELGFRDAVELSGQAQQEPTWSPAENRWVRRSIEIADSEDIRVWDSNPHAFDRIYLRTDLLLKKVRLRRVFDDSLSDHFGLLAEVALP